MTTGDGGRGRWGGCGIHGGVEHHAQRGRRCKRGMRERKGGTSNTQHQMARLARPAQTPQAVICLGRDQAPPGKPTPLHWYLEGNCSLTTSKTGQFLAGIERYGNDSAPYRGSRSGCPSFGLNRMRQIHPTRSAPSIRFSYPNSPNSCTAFSESHKLIHRLGPTDGRQQETTECDERCGCTIHGLPPGSKFLTHRKAPPPLSTPHTHPASG